MSNHNGADHGYHSGNGRAHSLSFVLVLMLIFIIVLGLLTGFITP